MSDAFFLRARAPFASFRWLQAGVYRATSPVIPPSAAYGLIMNLAAIEIREPSDGIVTGIRADAPTLQVCVGRGERASGVATLYEQLHSYRVGSDAKANRLAALAHGQKSWIAPASRELLLNLDALIGVRGKPGLRKRIEAGLRGDLDRAYGLPFAGSNAHLFDRIEVYHQPFEGRWYRVLGRGERADESVRLTVQIGRSDSGTTRTQVFYPAPFTADVPDDAWVDVGPIADEQSN